MSDKPYLTVRAEQLAVPDLLVDYPGWSIDMPQPARVRYVTHLGGFVIITVERDVPAPVRLSFDPDDTVVVVDNPDIKRWRRENELV